MLDNVVLEEEYEFAVPSVIRLIKRYILVLLRPVFMFVKISGVLWRSLLGRRPRLIG
jgi:hypothetical protein